MLRLAVLYHKNDMKTPINELPDKWRDEDQMPHIHGNQSEWRMITDEREKLADELEAALAEDDSLSTSTKPEEINTRLFDLCRYMRSRLLEAELITEKEYSFLMYNCPLAQGDGSPSPRRLEDYDRAKAAPAEQWQDIETAPKDEEFFAYDELGDRQLVEWCPEYDQWMGIDGDWIYPTHWMPLPEPPHKPAAPQSGMV